MIVVIRLEVPDNMRRTIRQRAGKPGLATHKEIAADVESIVDATWEEYSFEVQQREEESTRGD